MSPRDIVRLLVSITILAGCGDNIQPPASTVTVTPVAGLRTTEAGGQATFSVALPDRPSQDVLIELSSNDPGEGTISPATLTFTRDNFNAPQTITITGVQDEVADGPQTYTIVLAPAVSLDPRFDGLDGADVRVENIDDDTAGVTVTPLSGLTTTEAGGTAAFTVVLNSRPTASVAIALTSSDLGEGTISPADLTFTVDNWNAPQTVTVTGVDDSLFDPDQAYTVTTEPATSADPDYAGLDADDVSLTNTDNDTAGVTLSKTSGLTTSEKGGEDTFTIVLNSQPTADVTIALSSSDTGEGTVSPASVTFTPVNWNAPQTVTITGVNDDIADNNQPYTIVTGSPTTSDADYAALNPADAAATNTDDDVPGFVVTPTSGLTTDEDGLQATFTIVLISQPTADVTIPLTSSDPGEGTVSPSGLTFTPVNWNAPQTVTITGINDDIVDGGQPYTIVTGAATSSDASYAVLDPDDVSVTNADDDIPDIRVSKTSITTTEKGGQDTFTIVLISQPTADVTIALSSSDTGEGTVSPASVTFTPVNWNAPQTITITGVDDDIVDNNQLYSIVTAPATSADAKYQGLDAPDVAATNTDDDIPDIIVTPTTGLETDEDLGTATFTIVLQSQPTADVTIGLSSSDTTEGTVAPASVTFTPLNWNAPRTVTITGVNDDVVDGGQVYEITTAAATSADPLYNTRDAADVSVTNIDNDIARIVVTPTALSTRENNISATYTIVLRSQPTANVTIAVASGDSTEGSVSPASVTFTPINWNAPQGVTVTGIDDAVADGDQVYLVTNANAVSADPNYNGRDVADVSVTNEDDDSPGIRVTPTSGLSTTEAGGTATFEVVLRSEPVANVTIPLSSSDVGEGTIAQAALTFTPANWSSPQSVTVTGVNDPIVDGDQPYSITLAPATSSDPRYNTLDPADVAVTNRDNDIPGVLVKPTAGLTTSELGDSAFFTIELISQPLADVTITLASSDPSEGTLPITTLTFTPADWNLPKTLNVIGVNDAIIDGGQPYTVVTSATSSADPKFDGLPVDDVAVTNLDDDIPGFTIDPVGGLITSEFGDFDTFTIVLNQPPTADVTIGLSINDTSEVTLGGVTGVTFTPANWNVPQTVTVTGLDDALADGTQPFLVVTAPVVSADLNYSGLNPPDIDGTNFDNDTPGVYVKARRLLRTGENGSGAFFRVSLTTQPTADVTCTFSSSDTSEGTVSPTTLTFTPMNYAIQQNVTVQGEDDLILDGDQLYTVISAPCTSADGTYNLADPRDISVLNRDNE